MFRQTLKILQQKLQNFKSVSDHFGTLCIKKLNQLKYLNQPGWTKYSILRPN